jgi:hypothetical protein
MFYCFVIDNFCPIIPAIMLAIPLNNNPIETKISVIEGLTWILLGWLS